MEEWKNGILEIKSGLCGAYEQRAGSIAHGEKFKRRSAATSTMRQSTFAIRHLDGDIEYQDDYHLEMIIYQINSERYNHDPQTIHKKCIDNLFAKYVGFKFYA